MFSKKKNQVDENFMQSGIARVKEDDVKIAADSQEEISEKLLNSSLLRRYAELGKVMIGMLKDYRKGTYTSVPWFTIASIAFAFLYVINPLDLMPDFIPGIGYIDDFAVFTFALRFIESDIHSYLDWKLEEADSNTDLETA